MFPSFFGNASVAQTLEKMIDGGRIPQTILLSGPEGIGKATLARRFAAKLLGSAEKIESDDLSLPSNVALLSDRDKLAAEKRNDDPLLFSSHPDFLTFPPEGPLRQISIHQIRLLKERAQYKPLKGSYRVFLIDRFDRANEQAANSALKTLEEPPDHLILILTAENPHDLLPTIRSRAVSFPMNHLSPEDMRSFLINRDLDQAERRLTLAGGSPGTAIGLDLASFDRRRAAMLELLRAGSGVSPFADWAKMSDSLNSARGEKLEPYSRMLYSLLQDIVWLQHGMPGIRNFDIKTELNAIAVRVSFEWTRKALAKIDELVEFIRRNIQKNVALDALAIELRDASRS